MENYQIVVNNLATERGEKDTNLVLNVFQSLLDEFTRSYTKTDFEPAKVGSYTSQPQVLLCNSCASPKSSWPSPSHLVTPLSLSGFAHHPGTCSSSQPHWLWHHHLPGQPRSPTAAMLPYNSPGLEGHSVPSLPTSFLRTGIFLGDIQAERSSPHKLDLCLSAEQSPEEEAEAGACCE